MTRFQLSRLRFIKIIIVDHKTVLVFVTPSILMSGDSKKCFTVIGKRGRKEKEGRSE